jgi:predicted nucleic acid-binding protein
VKILFDTNVVLDVLLNRDKFVKNSSTLMSFVELGHLRGFLCATTITTLDYLISKTYNRKHARSSIEKLLSIFELSSVDAKVIDLALHSELKDFEDAVQVYSGVCSKVNGIVTRNPKDYKGIELPVYEPFELITICKSLKRN